MSHFTLPPRKFPFGGLVHKLPDLPKGPYDADKLWRVLSSHDVQHEQNLQTQLDWLTEQLAHSFVGVPLVHLRGQVTIAGTNTSATATFSPDDEQVDLNYSVFLTPAAFTGSPGINSRQVIGVVKAIDGITVEVFGPPGVGASVIFDYIVVREITR